MITRLALSLLLALSLVGLGSPAQAAGFYFARSCAVSPDGKARLSVTNWGIATGQRYHIDMNSTRYPVGYYQKAIHIDGGARIAGTNDVYRDYAARYATHTFKGVWFLSNGRAVSCTVTL